MQNRTRTIILIAVIAIILAVAGLAIYYFFFLAVPPEVMPEIPEAPEVPARLPSERPEVDLLPVAPPPPTPPEVLPPVIPPPALPEAELPEVSLAPQPGKDVLVESLSDGPVYGAALSVSGQSAYYYDKDEGAFYEVDADGRKSRLSDKNFHKVEKINWAPARREAILEYPDGSKIYYDFEKEKQATIPSNWHSFSFSPKGDKIAFMTDSVEPMDRWLAISNPDGSSTRAIEHVGENADKVNVDWSPNNQVVATSRTGEPLGAGRQEVLMVGLNGENFKSITVEGYDFDSIWSPSGRKMVYSVYTTRMGFMPTLWIVDAQGDDIGANNLYLGVQTWVDKCVFASDGKTLYCAVPENLPQGSGLIRELAKYSRDTWYKIDTETGAKEALANPTSYNVENPFLSSDNRTLYFTDRNSSLLQKIELE